MPWLTNQEPATIHNNKGTTFENFICHYSIPASIHSDQSRNFESSVIKELFKIAGVRKGRTTPYHQMGNGQIERFNQTLLQMLSTLDKEKQD